MVQLILLQIVTFAVLIAVLYFFFGNQLKVALNRLQVLHQESLEKEEVLRFSVLRGIQALPCVMPLRFVL